MSVASLENGNLTLGNLTINNSQYAEASGYTASQTVFSSSVNSTSLSVPSITSTGIITASQLSLPCGLINGSDGGGFNLISDNGTINIFNGSSSVSLECSSNNELTVGNGTTTGAIVTSQLSLPSTSFTGTAGGGLNITPSNGTIQIFNGSSSVPLVCSGSNSLVVGNGSTTGAITTTQLVLNCGSITGNAGSNFNFNVSSGFGITIINSNGSGSGTLSVNSSNQLLWNGVVIS